MLRPKLHEYAISFDGNSTDALQIARTALLALGFEVTRNTTTELQAKGPGMHGNQQPPLVGASLLRFDVSPTQISVTAELGGVAQLMTFVYLFPPLLVAGLLSMNAFIDPAISPLHALWVVAWAGAAPLIGRGLERKTMRAIDRLVRGMAETTS